MESLREIISMNPRNKLWGLTNNEPRRAGRLFRIDYSAVKETIPKLRLRLPPVMKIDSLLPVFTGTSFAGTSIVY